MGPAPEGTVTVLFTDIERSTVLLEQLGDHGWAQTLGEHDQVVRSAVADHGGFEVKAVGDGFMVAFSSATRALECAIAIQRALTAQVAGNAPLRVRIGLHTGEAVRRGDDYLGRTVVVAARIAAMAHAGEILVSALLRELVAGSRAVEIGAGVEVTLKGLSGSFVVHPVLWQAAPIAPPAPPTPASGAGSRPPAPVITMKLEGEYWTISGGATPIRVRAGKGIGYIAQLLERAGEPIHVLDLVAGHGEPASLEPAHAAQAGLTIGRIGDAGELLDATAKAAYRTRIDELSEELRQAREWSDPERERRLREELEFVANELSAAVGLGGRDRRAASSSERARVNVTRAIRAAIARVREHDAELGDHLDASIRTGAHCTYAPLELAPPAPAVSSSYTARPPTPRPLQPLPPLLLANDHQFVGRPGDRAELDAAWERRTTPGAPRIVMIAGEPGIGKTRLAAELAQQVHAAGATVMYGRCQDDNVVPYQPMVEALRAHMTGCRPERLASELGPAAATLARILPEMASAAARSDGAAPADPEGERYRLFDALTTAFAQAARNRPVLLILDDLHWADEPTVLALKYLVAAQERTDLLVVGTYRSTELPARTARLTETLGDLDRDGHLQTIALAGLELEAVIELITDWTGRPPTLEFAQTIRGQTEGNPFFIQQVLRHLLDTSAVEGGELDTADGAVTVPAGVKHVVGRRLEALSEATRSTLGLASVIGREFKLELLESVSRLGGDGPLDALDEALSSRLLFELPGQAGAYSFSHALVRETLYSGLSATRRARLHRRIGSALRAEAEDGRPPQLAALAHHFYEAGRDGDMADAVVYCTLAGHEASHQLAFEEAVDHYERAVKAQERLGSLDDAAACALLLALGDAAWRAGRVDLAKQTFVRAAGVATELSEARALARAALGYGFGDAVVQIDVGVTDPVGDDLLERALEALGAEDSPLRARVMGQLGDQLANTEHRERGVRLAADAVEMARRLGDKATLAFVLMKTYPALWQPADPERRLELLLEIAAIAHGLGDGLRDIQAHVWAFNCGLELADAEVVEREHRALRELTGSSRVPYAKWVSALIDAMRAQLQGRLAEVEVLAHQAFELGGTANAETAAQLFAVQILVLRRDQGRLDELRPLFDGVAARYSNLWAWTAAASTFYGDLGDWERAGEAISSLAARGLSELPVQFTWAVGMCFLAEGCRLVGDAALACEAYDLLAPHAGRCAVVPHAAMVGPIDGALASLAIAMERPELACEHLERAVAQAETLGADALATSLRARHALTLLQMGDGDPDARERGRMLARQARTAAEALGMSAVLAELAPVSLTAP